MFARVEHFLFEGIGSEMSTRRCPRTTQRTIVSRSEGRSGNETKQTRGARLEGGLAVRTYGVELKTAGMRIRDQLLRSLAHFLTKYQWLLDTYVIVSQCRRIMFIHINVRASYILVIRRWDQREYPWNLGVAIIIQM